MEKWCLKVFFFFLLLLAFQMWSVHLTTHIQYISETSSTHWKCYSPFSSKWGQNMDYVFLGLFFMLPVSGLEPESSLRTKTICWHNLRCNLFSILHLWQLHYKHCIFKVKFPFLKSKIIFLYQKREFVVDLRQTERRYTPGCGNPHHLAHHHQRTVTTQMAGLIIPPACLSKCLSCPLSVDISSTVVGPWQGEGGAAGEKEKGVIQWPTWIMDPWVPGGGGPPLRGAGVGRHPGHGLQAVRSLLSLPGE